MLWLNKKDISQLASDIGMPPAYIEKDLHLIKVMQTIKGLDTDKHQFVFTGGTSLSKGHKIINRFSEDIDFNVKGAATMTRGERSKLRDNLIAKIQESGYIINNLIKANESRFFSIEIEYPKIFDTPTQLRQNLLIEVAYNEPRLAPELKDIQSFFCQYDKTAPATEFLCLSLTEIAANKVNALLWRTNSQKALEDTALTRHLYDLSAMKPYIMNDELARLTRETFETDKKRADSVLSFNSAIFMATSKLESEPAHRKNYSVFVERMVYGGSNKLSFQETLNDFKQITAFIQKHKDNTLNKSKREYGD